MPTASTSNGTTTPSATSTPSPPTAWTKTAPHNAQNEITGISGSVTPSFDANGNMTLDETGRLFYYDAWNRLVRATDTSGNPLAAYEYDPNSRRIQSVEPGETRDFFYTDAWQVIEERVAGIAERQYVWSPVYVDAMIERDWDSDGNGLLETRHYALQDANFNVTSIITTAGVVAERNVIDPFGQRTIVTPGWAIISASTIAWVHAHQGLRLELQIGLYENRERWYSPGLMRFASADLIAATNLYLAYTNRPISMMDPLGLDSIHSSFSYYYYSRFGSNYVLGKQDVAIDFECTKNGDANLVRDLYEVSQESPYGAPLASVGRVTPHECANGKRGYYVAISSVSSYSAKGFGDTLLLHVGVNATAGALTGAIVGGAPTGGIGVSWVTILAPHELRAI